MCVCGGGRAITEGFSEHMILKPNCEHGELTRAKWVEEYSRRGLVCTGESNGAKALQE